MIESKLPPYRLGLDIGANSIGWAALALNANGDPYAILDMGSRVFPDGRAPEKRSGPGASLAVGRRLARGQRRRRKRYLRRRAALMRKLVAFGLMPANKQERKKLERFDPYELRKRALSETLEPSKLGRALFHLHQRRGFKSNRKTGGGEDKQKATQARMDREGLRQAISDRGNPTLGEFLAGRRERGKPVRARPGQELYPERAMYAREFKKIRARQEENHALTPAQWDELERIIFHQRPLKPVKPGWCALEDNTERAPRSHPCAQEFRILEEVNNLRVSIPGNAERRPEERRLKKNERELALARLRRGADIALQPKPPKKLSTKALGLPTGSSFNLARGGRKTLKGDAVVAAIVKTLKPPKKKGEKAKKDVKADKWWRKLSKRQRRKIAFLFAVEEDADAACKQAQEWGLDASIASRLKEGELPSGYVRLSLKAIRNILPHLRRGLRYDEAVIAAGYPHPSDFRNAEAHDRLPYYGVVLGRYVVGADPAAPEADEAKRYGRFPNPTVHVGLNQLRLVVNRLIAVYGKPQDIVVELARELKMNKDQREARREAQQKGEERNKRFEEMLGREPSPRERLRLRLWEEQRGSAERDAVCVYTGEPITLDMAVSSATERDHVLPFSKTLDDGRGNMVLCMARANRDKGDKTPYEAFADSPDGYDYAAILARAGALPGKRGWRFEAGAMKRFGEEEQFLDRHLNETAYLSRTARRYLAYLYDETTEGYRVRAIPGRMTALLRNAWGLGKSRKDHRHHAVDAFVVANTTQGLLKRFADASAGGTAERLAKSVPDPWCGFRANFEEAFERVIVSYKPDQGTRDPKSRKTTGKLHNATAYGLLKEPGKVVVRKPLADFKKKEALNAVRDPALREALLVLWDETGGNKKKKEDTASSFSEKARVEGVLPKGKGRRQYPRSVRVLDKVDALPIKDESGKPYKGFNRDSNAFAEIWSIPAGKDKEGKRRKAGWRIIVVPAFEFNQRGFDEKTLRPHPAAKRLARIHKGDMAALELKPESEAEKKRVIVRVRKITGGSNPSIVLDKHFEANVAKRAADKSDATMQENKYSARKLRESAFRKVGVDEIGRLHDTGQFREAGGAADEPKPATRKKAAKPRPAEKPRQLGLSLGG